MTKTEWKASDTSVAKRLGDIEIETTDGFEHFELLKLKDRIVFGGSCNTCFLESGFILREDGEHIDETLQELVADLEVYYRDGAQYVSRIVCNERM